MTHRRRHKNERQQQNIAAFTHRHIRFISTCCMKHAAISPCYSPFVRSQQFKLQCIRSTLKQTAHKLCSVYLPISSLLIIKCDYLYAMGIEITRNQKKKQTLQRKHCNFISLESKRRKSKECVKCKYARAHQVAGRAGVTFIAIHHPMLFIQEICFFYKYPNWCNGRWFACISICQIGWEKFEMKFKTNAKLAEKKNHTKKNMT